jgi:hypothetical protein
MFFPKIFKSVALIFIVFVTVICLTTSLNATALEFVTPDDRGNVKVSLPKTNLSVAGNQVDISSKTSKDLIAAGGNVTITGDVERNLIASAGNLNIQSKNIGASVRIAGGNISLKDTVIAEDLIVAGGTLSLSNVQVKGDTYFAGGTLDITNSNFVGSLDASYGNYNGDNLDNMVLGKLNAYENAKLKDEVKSYRNNIWEVFWPGQIGVLYGLILLLIFLSNKKALGRFEDIGWNSKFWVDMLVGFAFLILTPAVFVFSIVLLGFTFTGSLWMMIYSILFLSTVFLPIYIAKLLKNSFKVKTTVVITSFIVWFVLLVNAMLSNVIPIFWIISLLAFLVNLSAFGYIINHILRIINKSFEPKQAEAVEFATYPVY